MTAAPRILAVIPARYASSRFPGKPLASIRGRPMIQWVYEAAARAKLVDSLVVATDHAEILACVRGFGGEAVMATGEYANGTERVAAVAAQRPHDIVINIQGDLPLLEGWLVDELARPLVADPALDSATLARVVTAVEELDRPELVQVVMTQDHHALYFSRAPIPYCHTLADRAAWLRAHTYYRHIGLYGYRDAFLRRFVEWGPSPLERVEGLEMLRVLEHGGRMKVAVTDWHPLPVDRPGDIPAVERMLEHSE